MIVTLTNCKENLGISVSTYDSRIKRYIPIVESIIVKYCLNEFVDTYESIQGILPTVYMYSNTFEFLSSDNSINNSDLDFTSYQWKVGDNIRFYNTLHNDKPFTISSITANKMIFEDINTIIDEDNDNTFVAARVTYPDIAEFTASEMIAYKLNLDKIDRSVKSEKFDDYSYTNWDTKDLYAGFPASILSGLDNYQSAFLKTIPANLMYWRQL